LLERIKLIQLMLLLADGANEEFITIQHKMNLTFGVKHTTQWSTQYPIGIDLNQ